MIQGYDCFLIRSCIYCCNEKFYFCKLIITEHGGIIRMYICEYNNFWHLTLLWRITQAIKKKLVKK